MNSTQLPGFNQQGSHRTVIRNSLRRRLLVGGAITAIAAIVASGCTGSPSPSPDSKPSLSETTAAATETSTGTGTGTVEGKGSTGTDVVLTAQSGPAPRLFQVNLSPGQDLATGTANVTNAANATNAASSNIAAAPVIDGTDLDSTRVGELVDRLPPWQDAKSLTSAFSWPKQSPPPPRIGKTVTESFPPKDPGVSTPSVSVEPLKVLRMQPEGNVPIAPYLTVTFNQPMVPVGTLGQLDANTVPVKLEPAVAGRWQWIGTRTLRFDAEAKSVSGDNLNAAEPVDRLPMATTFTATVPAGTRSATGATLATSATFAFTTPAPIVTQFSPQGDGVITNPVFVAGFDQRIDPAAVLKTIRIRPNGNSSEALEVRQATAAEVDADVSAKNLSKTLLKGRWVAFKPVRALNTGTAHQVVVGPNTPSAEGPQVTATPQTFGFKTFDRLTIKNATCNYGSDCPPGSQFYIEFSNPLSSQTDTETIKVTPVLAAQQIRAEGNVIVVQGATLARTKYTISFPASLTDIHGQELGSDQSRSMTIGSAAPTLWPLPAITTLDPFATSPKLSILTTNHRQLRVRVFEANPAKFDRYLIYANQRSNPEEKMPNWKVLSDQKIQTKGNEDADVETLIDLSAQMKGRLGQAIVLVESVPAPKPGTDEYYENQPILTWVQSTKFALDAFVNNDTARIWATDLRSGTPVSGLQVQGLVGNGTASDAATTNAEGVVTLRLPTVTQLTYVWATREAEAFILPVFAATQLEQDSLRWFTFDDRQIYKPGESVRLKGWVREAAARSGNLSIVAGSVGYTVSDSFGNEIAAGTASLGALGGFDLTIAIPETANLGAASIQLTAAGSGSGNHQFQIADFRRPEYEVKVEPISPAPFVSTRPLTMETKANYLAGGALPGAPVNWVVSTSETSFSPPGWDGFTFGIFQPWWYGDRGGFESDSFGSFPRSPASVKQYAATTDANGRNLLQLDFKSDKGGLPDLPVSVNVSSTVTDVNRQAWADQRAILVHSADRYVGLRSDRTFVRQNDPLVVEAIVTDVDGKVQTGGGLTVTAGLIRSEYKNGKFVEEIFEPQTCEVNIAAEPSKCSFRTKLGGQYRVTSTITDRSGGRNRSELTVWVSGAQTQPARTVEQESLTVVPDKKTYAVGDTANLLVQAPFGQGEGLAVIASEGTITSKRFALESGTAQITIPITGASVPGFDVTIEVVGASVRTAFDGTVVAGAPKRPAYAAATVSLAVPAVRQTLTVKAKPAADTLLPGGSTKIAVSVNDATGAPVRDAEFAVVVVDEAVLGLTKYTLGDPLSIFTGAAYDFLRTEFGRTQVRLVDPLTLSREAKSGNDGVDSVGADLAVGQGALGTEAAAAEAAPAIANDRVTAPSARFKSVAASGPSPIPAAVRSNFEALALFQPAVRTGADGSATVEVTLPDNLTRYRIMVVAASGADRFGKAESTITARLPLSVRPSAPRFLNVGDEFELPIVVQNNSDQSASVDVLIQLANLDPVGITAGSTAGSTASSIVGSLGQRVEVAAGNRVEVRFPVKVRSAGTARFRASVFGTGASDSAEGSIPVFTPGTTEAFATYGVIDQGVVRQPLLAPTGVIESYGGLDITTSSTSLQSLTDALLYVDTYTYQSSDAHASRIMAIGALRDVLKDFGADGLPTSDELNRAVLEDVTRLAAMQNDDGGFPYWRRYQRSEPYNTVQAVHALVLAKQAGYNVPAAALERGLQAVSGIDSFFYEPYSETERDAVRSYALWVRALAGQRDRAKALALFQSRGNKLPLDALAWIWGSLDNSAAKATIERTISNRAVDTAGAVSFTSGYSDGQYLTLQSDRRTDAIVLEALIANTPKSDLVEKTVAGLLAGRTSGRWGNIQENSFALLAFKRYYDTYESASPNFVAKAWLGEQFAGAHSFVGRSTDRSRISVPMDQLIKGGNRDLVLAKDGSGRLYYRVGLRYVPANLKLDALDRGFVVSRTYEGVDAKSDVTRDANGTWRIKAGAKVRVKLTMVAESERTHVALVDPLPAGMESLNSSLAVTQPVVDQINGPLEQEQFARSWWWGNWFEHEQLRDDRVEAFATYVSAGVYDYSYIARATTPGSFVVPPTRAEEMYAPETFGRTATDRVVIG